MNLGRGRDSIGQTTDLYPRDRESSVVYGLEILFSFFFDIIKIAETDLVELHEG